MLARYGVTAKAPAIKLLAEPRRTATLLATAQALETAAVDDALDLFEVMMATRLISAARRSSAAERLAWMPRLEKASVTLARTARALLDALEEAGADAAGQIDVATAWAVVEQVAPREQVTAAAALVDELVPDDYSGEAAMREALAAKYGVVRPFLELLAEAVPLRATPAGEALLAEVRRLPDLARRRAVFTNPDLPTDAVDRDAYVLCVLEQLHRALRRRDVFAAPSLRCADPRAQNCSMAPPGRPSAVTS